MSVVGLVVDVRETCRRQKVKFKVEQNVCSLTELSYTQYGLKCGLTPAFIAAPPGSLYKQAAT